MEQFSVCQWGICWAWLGNFSRWPKILLLVI
jgi:hypothetical protein